MTPSVKVLFLSAAFLSAAHVAAAHPRHSDASPGLAHAAPASSCAGQGGWGAIIQADRPSACPDEPMPEQLLARIATSPDGGGIGFQPLLGGLSPAEGWKSMKLLEQTMPAIRAAIQASA